MSSLDVPITLARTVVDRGSTALEPVKTSTHPSGSGNIINAASPGSLPASTSRRNLPSPCVVVLVSSKDIPPSLDPSVRDCSRNTVHPEKYPELNANPARSVRGSGGEVSEGEAVGTAREEHQPGDSKVMVKRGESSGELS